MKRGGEEGRAGGDEEYGDAEKHLGDRRKVRGGGGTQDGKVRS